MQQGQVIMLSLFHNDPKGEERILTMLKRLNPDIVTLEYSEEMDKYLKSERAEEFTLRVGNTLKARGFTEKELKSKFNPWIQLTFNPFEVKGARKYCKDIMPLYFIDLWDEQEMINHEKLQIEAAESYSIDSLKSAFDPKNFEKRVASQYRQFVLFPQHIPLDDVEVGRRDEFMEVQLRKIVKENPGKKVVHIGGVRHSLDDPWLKRTLYSRIKDLNPERHLLTETERR